MSEATWLLNLNPRSDARIRLICAHHAGGSAQYFDNWWDCLPPHYELLAVNLPGRGFRRSEPLIHNLQTVVAGLTDALSSITDRPFAFFGDSIGALICFEVIRELRRRNAPMPLRLFASGMVAPQLVWWDPDAPLHRMTDLQLFEGLVRKAGMLDDDLLANDELREVMTPVLRADLEIAETYSYQYESPLELPITAIRGDSDTLLTAEQLEAWSQQTGQDFDHLTFSGAHFYSRENRAALLEMIDTHLAKDLAHFPLSVVDGESLSIPDQCLHEVFSDQAKQTPEAIALAQPGRHYSYAELDAATDQLARWIIAQDILPGDLVGIFMERCVEHVIALIAINKAGAIFMPLETGYPEDTLRRFIEVSGAKLFLTRSRWIEDIPSDLQNDRIWASLDDDWRDSLLTVANTSDQSPLPKTKPRDTVFMSMSSGTSGAPKGICQSHRACLNAYWHRFRTAAYTSNEQEACHVYFIWYVWLPLLRGATAWVVPEEVIYDPALLVDFIEAHQINRSTISPSLLERILRAPGLDQQTRLSSLTNITIIGEVVPTALIAEFFAILPDCTLTHAYGCAETHDAVSQAFTREIPLGDSDRIAPIGLPQINQYLYILDDQDRPQPRGVAGEVFIGGDSLANGYFQDPDNTALRFVPDPLRGNGMRLFKTGDQGRVLRDGSLQIFGRLDSMVKLRGYSIMLGVVEAALLEYPNISNAVVIASNDPETGRPDHLIGYVVTQSGEDEWGAEMYPFLRDRLPHYALPAYVVPLPMLPVDARSNSKIDRRGLPIAQTEHRLSAAELRPPGNQQEWDIHRIWCETLDQNDIGIDDNFFALGGHSLLAADLCGQLNVRQNWNLRVADLFANPTIAELSEYLASNH